MEDGVSSCDRVTVCPRAAVSDSWNVSSSSARTSPHPCTWRFADPFPSTFNSQSLEEALGSR
ncbi:unnamed protein product [Ectocarpus sp. 8 AP-2014]